MTPDFTIADVLAWARTKPADEGYRYGDGVWSDKHGGCALCHFLKDTDRAASPVVIPMGKGADGAWSDGFTTTRQSYPGALEYPLQEGTFGRLAISLEKLCPDTSVPPSEWTRLDTYMADIELASA